MREIMVTPIAAILLFTICANAQKGKDLNISVVDFLKKLVSDPGVPDLQSGNATSSNETCTCLMYYLCNRKGLINFTYQKSPCRSFLEVCCKKEDQIDLSKSCGYRNPDGIGPRTTGENLAQFGEFPWMVAILAKESAVYQCRGALVHPQVVLTAAHCISGKNDSFIIRAGEWDTQNTLEQYPHQDREVQSISIHPQYDAQLLYNDIALLFLKSPVDIVQNVNVLCLPPSRLVVDDDCYITGWGEDSYGKKGKQQVILKKLDIPLVPRDTCQSKLKNTRLGAYLPLHGSLFCAGGEERKDNCIGDRGSPLVCPIQGNPIIYYQVGIVAWRLGCGENEVPGVYVNVPFFRGWIDEQIKAKNLEISR